jgi:hypothetical protein
MEVVTAPVPYLREDGERRGYEPGHDRGPVSEAPEHGSVFTGAKHGLGLEGDHLPVAGDVDESLDDAFRSGVLVSAAPGHDAVLVWVVVVKRDVGHIIGDE